MSHINKFVTIDIPKTGTRSMRETLKPLGLIDIHGGPQSASVGFWQHSTALEAKTYFVKQGWDWNSYFKYVVVRNPWDRYLSFINYFKFCADNYTKSKEGLTPEEINQGKASVSFFCGDKNPKEIMLNLIQRTGGIWMSQDQYFKDEKGELIVDYIANFDNINDEFKLFCKKNHIDKSITLKHGNKSRSFFKKEDVFCDQSIDLIKKRESFIIDLMKYNYK